jgi:hypothetical protein
MKAESQNQGHLYIWIRYLTNVLVPPFVKTIAVRLSWSPLAMRASSINFYHGLITRMG